eukprot:4784789-Pleurochrysis_carterae.AAC.3
MDTPDDPAGVLARTAVSGESPSSGDRILSLEGRAKYYWMQFSKMFPSVTATREMKHIKLAACIFRTKTATRLKAIPIFAYVVGLGPPKNIVSAAVAYDGIGRRTMQTKTYFTQGLFLTFMELTRSDVDLAELTKAQLAHKKSLFRGAFFVAAMSCQE